MSTARHREPVHPWRRAFAWPVIASPSTRAGGRSDLVPDGVVASEAMELLAMTGERQVPRA
jgi:hypothetical protein